MYMCETQLAMNTKFSQLLFIYDDIFLLAGSQLNMFIIYTAVGYKRVKGNGNVCAVYS